MTPTSVLPVGLVAVFKLNFCVFQLWKYEVETCWTLKCRKKNKLATFETVLVEGNIFIWFIKYANIIFFLMEL